MSPPGEKEREFCIYTATSKLRCGELCSCYTLQEVSTGYGSECVCACIKVEVKEVMVGSGSMSMATVVEI